MDKKSFDLVLEGSGAMGTSFVGALQELFQRGYGINRLMGVSAGAIVATLLAAGYDPSELQSTYMEKDPSGRSVFAAFILNIPLQNASFSNAQTNQNLPNSSPYTDTFTNWLSNRLDTGTSDWGQRSFSGLSLSRFYDLTGRELSLVATDTTANQMLVLNHNTAPHLPLVLAARMSMGIPLLWPEITWQSGWGGYQGREISGHAIVDGSLMSNFPIELYLSDLKDVTGIIGERQPEVEALGMLLDANLSVPGLESAPSGSATQELYAAPDKNINESVSDLVVRIPARGVQTAEFDIPDQRRYILIETGRRALAEYFERRANPQPTNTIPPSPTPPVRPAKKSARKTKTVAPQVEQQQTESETIAQSADPDQVEPQEESPAEAVQQPELVQTDEPPSGPDPAEINRRINNRAQAVLNDRAQGMDQLGIKGEVEALVDSLLLREVEPPVAVGVMGGWGSGKSFVMHLFNERVREIRAKRVLKGWPDVDASGIDKKDDPDVPAYVGHIYQISFNAWTYAKSNLWASLMDTIFSELNRQMQLELLLAHKDFAEDAKLEAQDIHNSLMRGGGIFKKIYTDNYQLDRDPELDSNIKKNLKYWGGKLLNENILWHVMRDQQTEKIVRLRDTDEQIRQLKDRRDKFEKDQQKKETRIETLDPAAKQAYFQSMKSLTLGFVSDMLSKSAKTALTEQGVTKEQIDAALEDANSLKGGLRAIRKDFQRNKLYLVWFLTFMVITLVVPFVWLRYAEQVNLVWLETGLTALATLGPVLVSGTKWLLKVIDYNKEAKKVIEGAYSAQQAKNAERISTDSRMTFEQKIVELQAEIGRGSLPAYDALISLLETRAESQRQQVGPSARYVTLLEFVQSRLDEKTYNSQLGLMQLVRDDIDELTYSLSDNASREIFPRGKPRVILYIDDLDRCPPSRVVEVLEAMQLLLNTKLFVLVLGLDTRYVTRALEKEYKEILKHEGDPSGLDYIEKIIQIPYRVRPIEREGLKTYLTNQMDIEPTPGSAPAQKTAPPAADAAQHPQPGADAGPGATPAQGLDFNNFENILANSQAAHPPTPVAPAEHAQEPEPVEMPAAVIKFIQEDLDDLNTCCQQISLTPRSIKRLVNVLKLMKIYWYRSLQQDRPRPVKQAAMSMLALSSAYPEVMRESFVSIEDLYRRGDGQTDLLSALSRVRLPPGSSSEIDWQLQKYSADIAALKTMPGVDSAFFGQVTLEAFGAATFNLVRSFSFVGDPVFWSDGDEDGERTNAEQQYTRPRRFPRRNRN